MHCPFLFFLSADAHHRTPPFKLVFIGFSIESVDSSSERVREAVSFTVLLLPSYLSCMNTWWSPNRLDSVSILLAQSPF